MKSDVNNVMDFESRWIRRVQQSAHEESANLLVKKYQKVSINFKKQKKY